MGKDGEHGRYANLVRVGEDICRRRSAAGMLGNLRAALREVQSGSMSERALPPRQNRPLVQCERCGRVYLEHDPPIAPNLHLGTPIAGGAFIDDLLPPCCREGHFRPVIVLLDPDRKETPDA